MAALACIELKALVNMDDWLALVQADAEFVSLVVADLNMVNLTLDS